MKYLIIDASLNGTGIRDKYEGIYLTPEELGIDIDIINQINIWLLKYEKEQYKGFCNDILIDALDKEGKALAIIINNILKEVKIEYFSSARMTIETIKQK